MKNKYLVGADRGMWLALVWLMGVVLVAQAQTSQPPVIEWQRVVETGSNSGSNIGQSAVVKNSQGGYSVMTGDRRLLFLTSAGSIVTDTPIMGGSVNGGMTPSLLTTGLAPTADGGVVLVVQDGTDWSLQKRDAGGALVWASSLLASNSAGFIYSPANVAPSSDGGFIVFGNYRYRSIRQGPPFVTAHKIDKNGVQVWYKAINFGGNDTSVLQAINTPDGGYLLTGSTYVPSNNNIFTAGWATKLDEQGNEIWRNRYDQISSFSGVALYSATNGAYVLHGTSFSGPPYSFVSSSLIVDGGGNPTRGMPALFPFDSFGSLSSIAALPQTSRPSVYAIATDTPLSTNGGDIRVTGFSDQGNTIWTKTLGGSSQEQYGFNSSIVSTDDGLIIAGTTTSTDGDVQGKSGSSVATWIVKLKNAAPANALTLSQPTYDCQTGAITFNTSGGDGSPITYNAPGISRVSATSNTGIVEQGLRNDPKPITITATQGSYSTSFTFDLRGVCSRDQPPVLARPIPDFTFTVGVPVNESLSQYFDARASLNSIQFVISQLPPGLSLNYSASDLVLLLSNMPTTPGVYLITLTATNRTLALPNNSASATFKITVVDPPVVTPPTPPPGTDGTLTLLPVYNCVTGVITFLTSKGDGSPITYSAPGISRSSPTSSTGVVESGLRNDPKPILIQATQSGYTISYVFDLPNACNSVKPPVLIRPIPDLSMTVGQPFPYYTPAIIISHYFTDPNRLSRRYKTVMKFTGSGLPAGLYLTDYGTDDLPRAYIEGMPTVPGTYTVTVVASLPLLFTLGDTRTTTTFKITVADKPVVNPPATPTGDALTLQAPAYDCTTGAIIFRNSGGDGSAVEYRALGITDWTTNPNQFVDAESRTANDVQPFMLMARQNGVTITYVWDLKVACGRARQGVSEQVAELSVSVLGNPVSDAVTVEVRGSEGQPLSLRLLDSRGRLVEGRTVEQAGSSERQRFALPTSGPGLLLLRVSSGTRSQTVKIIKQ